MYNSNIYTQEGIEAFAKEITVNANFLAEDIPSYETISLSDTKFKIEIDIKDTSDEFDQMMATYEKAVQEQ